MDTVLAGVVRPAEVLRMRVLAGGAGAVGVSWMGVLAVVAGRRRYCGYSLRRGFGGACQRVCRLCGGRRCKGTVGGLFITTVRRGDKYKRNLSSGSGGGGTAARMGLT